MATPSSILAWEIPWTEEPGGLQFIEGQKSPTQLRKEGTLMGWRNLPGLRGKT